MRAWPRWAESYTVGPQVYHAKPFVCGCGGSLVLGFVELSVVSIPSGTSR